MDEVYEERMWWTPGGIISEEHLARESCPYYIASNGGPKDLPGRYGPGTCNDGCWEEPRCMTG